jgi:putative membrane protein
MHFLLRLVASALGLWLATQIVPGVSYAGWQSLAAAALLLGIINAIVRPVVQLLTLPLTLLTLGLFLFVINGAMLGLVGALLDGFTVNGFWPAVLGSIVVSLTTWVASALTDGKKR